MGTEAKRPSKASQSGSVAQRLIAEAKAKSTRVQQLTPLAIEHLQELCDYNDSVVGNTGRVSIEQAAQSLQTFGWKGGRDALNAVCRTQLRRKSFAVKS